MRYEIRSVSVWSVIKVSFFLNLVIGFAYGMFSAFFMGAMLSAGGPMMIPELDQALVDMSMGGLMILMPIMFAIFGAVFMTLITAVFVLIYNLLAKIIGGYELELNLTQESPIPRAVEPARQQPRSAVPPPPPPADSPPVSPPQAPPVSPAGPQAPTYQPPVKPSDRPPVSDSQPGPAPPPPPGRGSAQTDDPDKFPPEEQS